MDPDEKRVRQEDCNEDTMGIGCFFWKFSREKNPARIAQRPRRTSDFIDQFSFFKFVLLLFVDLNKYEIITNHGFCCQFQSRVRFFPTVWVTHRASQIFSPTCGMRCRRKRPSIVRRRCVSPRQIQTLSTRRMVLTRLPLEL